MASIPASEMFPGPPKVACYTMRVRMTERYDPKIAEAMIKLLINQHERVGGLNPTDLALALALALAFGSDFH
ncbi:hypothetical protein Pmar_PMAR011627 [Perkinsus marinus ATCC 50983]|uniref:Uncharacterized protein n=1 Tax=Perkinsus marinus (strain ATCC 50983 / TXsc) TaxID=423536 RepID=C5LCB3_PERM5|nr:hypothetical protein Pmar_PMAR011627 [Perkinsus marinus ATCC 50983]EER05596.1 hypothetical protein Pmar_PMAR011627 [Perkinsus marinus ATCC 50983]|eukprot:XP_002773780.1 hypothetical protein Pmar_PMAR011627 [Perkinsus marinus ATCC 50983]